ncbi:hypothetical protein TTRE_0000909901 [Trichuris trichiura]|uniref:Uncharacterized protein n=1 Tax=Trichuris trichiura TaxID=36087 RepID=A0A077ZLT7_TRITR|nr:hypothetical protein TTRE_0000909901 [Trichuris trichiura]
MLYSLFNGSPLSIKSIIFKKIKPIILSFNLNILSFKNSSLILCLLSIILLIFIISFLHFHENLNFNVNHTRAEILGYNRFNHSCLQSHL